MNPQAEMNQYLNRLLSIFFHVTKVPRDDNHIEKYLSTMDDAKGLLAKLCTKDLAECIVCKGCEG